MSLPLSVYLLQCNRVPSMSSMSAYLTPLGIGTSRCSSILRTSPTGVLISPELERTRISLSEMLTSSPVTVLLASVCRSAPRPRDVQRNNARTARKGFIEWARIQKTMGGSALIVGYDSNRVSSATTRSESYPTADYRTIIQRSKTRGCDRTKERDHSPRCASDKHMVLRPARFTRGNLAEVVFHDFSVLGRHAARQFLNGLGLLLGPKLAPFLGHGFQFLLVNLAGAGVPGNAAILHGVTRIGPSIIAAVGAAAVVAVAAAVAL